MKIEGAGKLAGALGNLMRLAGEAPRLFAELILEEARRNAPRRSGRLVESMMIRRTRSGYDVVMGGGGAPHAPYLEFGTRSHIIRPRRARALRFEIRGEVVYARYVIHPGSRPMGIMARAISEASKEFGKRIEKAISNAMRKIL